MYKVSLNEAKARILFSNGLIHQPIKKLNEINILQILEHLSYVQIDTISVVERAHHHVFWSRYPKHNSHQLHELIKNKQAFEYWSHAAAFLPMKDYRFTLPRKKRHLDGEAHWFKITPEHLKQRKLILARIHSEGPLQSKDFERPKKLESGWFNHSICKQTLEKLYMDGILMISERQGFQKVYDLTERVLPQNINIDFPTESEMAQYLIKSCLKSQAIATEKEIGYLRHPQLKKDIRSEIKNMVKSGELIEIRIDNLNDQYYSLSEDLNKKIIFPKNNNQVKIISPFDNLTIQRQRLKNIFNFSYQIECYVPKPKRKYGYFTLPLLYQNNFIGVIDLKAHRAQKKLEVISVFTQKKYHKDEDFMEALNSELQAFAKFNNCEIIAGFKKVSNYVSRT